MGVARPVGSQDSATTQGPNSSAASGASNETHEGTLTGHPQPPPGRPVPATVGEVSTKADTRGGALLALSALWAILADRLAAWAAAITAGQYSSPDSVIARA